MKKSIFSALAFVFVVASASAQSGTGGSGSSSSGVVYTLTNSSVGNSVQSFIRSADGLLRPGPQFPTLGLGSGGTGTGQGSLTMSDNGKWVYAVNGGSNSLTLFKVDGNDLEFSDIEPSGGVAPISVASSGNLVYVVNAGTATAPGNIQGFIRFRGQLVPLPGGSWNLSAIGATPEEIKFTADGDALVVTEKGTNLIDVFQLDFFGQPFTASYEPSNGGGPFGFDIDSKGRFFVTEAGTNSVSSYNLDPLYNLDTITQSAATDQLAPCWATVSPNGNFVYTSDAHSNVVSAFAIAKNGAISSISPNGLTASVATPLDTAFTPDGAFFYVLSAGKSIVGFKANANGSLTQVDTAGVLPGSAIGLIVK